MGTNGSWALFAAISERRTEPHRLRAFNFKRIGFALRQHKHEVGVLPHISMCEVAHRDNVWDVSTLHDLLSCYNARNPSAANNVFWVIFDVTEPCVFHPPS